MHPKGLNHGSEYDLGRIPPRSVSTHMGPSVLGYTFPPKMGQTLSMRCGWIGVALVAATTACASARSGTTWEQDQAEGIGASSRSSARASRLPPRQTVSISADQPAENYAALATELELAILRFTTLRRTLSAEQTPSDPPVWTEAMRSTWSQLLVTLDSGLSRPPGVLPRRLLIQTRVTLDVELETTARRYGPAPETIRSGVTQVFLRVAQHMRAQPRYQSPERRSNAELAMIWPVSPLILTSPFGYRRDPILGESEVRFHAGVDLGGSNGDLVSAAAPGRVVSASWLGGHGRTVVVQHAGGYSTVYAHLRDMLVKPGMSVETGTPLGLMGSSGRSTGPHLHFEVRHGGLPLDPLEAISLEASRFAQN